VNFGGYHIRDVRFVAAFDVNKNKIGKDLAEAIFTEPNCCAKFAKVPELGVKVVAGPILDGVAEHMKEPFNVYGNGENSPADVVGILKESKADMLINYLPVGSSNATRFYAQATLDAGCAFVNCMPEFIASDSAWSRKFEEKGLPVAGDDVKSQLGATILHRNLARLCVDRGILIDETYQLNLGGDTDFQNMTVEERLKTKRISKTEAVKSLVPYDLPTRIGPSDYVYFLGNKKICYLWLKGRKFGDRPLTITVKLEVEDSPNSAGVVIDVIRAAKLALDRKIAGSLISISSYAFKHPPIQVPDSLAKQWVEEYIEGKRER
jgi:myo-inositol-1-phosphate synthase